MELDRHQRLDDARCLRPRIGRTQIQRAQGLMRLAGSERDRCQRGGTRLKLGQGRLRCCALRSAEASASSAAPLPAAMPSICRQKARRLVRRDQQRSFAPPPSVVIKAEIEHAAPGIDRDGKRRRPAAAASRARPRHHAQAVGAIELGPGGEGETARGGNGDAHAGEASRAHRSRRSDRARRMLRSPLSGSTSATIGISASAWPRAIASSRRRRACALRLGTQAARPSRRPCWCRARGCSWRRSRA